MAKDPAFIFYPQDFVMGTMFMTDEQVGKYVRLLCAQHQQGGLIIKDVFNAVVGDHQLVRDKFVETPDGFFNERLMAEMKKRAVKSSNLSDNAKKRWENHCKSNANVYAGHEPIEDEIEDENERGLKKKNVARETFDILRATYDQYVRKMQGADESTQTILLSEMSFELYEAVAKDPSFERGSAIKRDLSELFKGFIEKGCFDEGAVHDLLKPRDPSPSPRLSKSEVRHVAVQRAPPRATFKSPSLEEVTAYITEKGSKVDPVAFHAYYEARDWKDIKKWKSCVTTWEQRRAEFAPVQSQVQGKPQAEVVALQCVVLKMDDQAIKRHMMEKGYTEQRIVEAISKARGKKVE